ncbi:tetratricopeptide repeat protein [Gemmatimonadota bacterium]
MMTCLIITTSFAYPPEKSGYDKAQDFIPIINKFLEDEMYDSAIVTCKRALEYYPKHALSYYKWGYALYKTGIYGSACEKFEKSLEIHPQLAEAHLFWGGALQKMGQPGKAKEHFITAIDSFDVSIAQSKTAQDYTLYALAYSSVHKYANAIEKLRIALDKDPNNAIIYYNLATCMHEEKKYEQAIDYYNHAIEIDSSDYSPRLGKAFCLMHSGRIEEANYELNSIVTNEMAAPYAFLLLYKYYKRIGRKDDAIRVKENFFNMSNKKIFNKYDSIFYLTSGIFKSNCPDSLKSAMVELEKSYLLDRENGDAIINMLLVLEYIKKNRMQYPKRIDYTTVEKYALEYLKYIDSLIAGKYITTQTFFEKGDVNLLLNNYDEARNSYNQQLFMLKEDNKEILAKYYFRNGQLKLLAEESVADIDKIKGALDNFMNTLQYAENNIMTKVNVGYCELKLGNYGRAKNIFEDILANNPGIFSASMGNALALIYLAEEKNAAFYLNAIENMESLESYNCEKNIYTPLMQINFSEVNYLIGYCFVKIFEESLADGFEEVEYLKMAKVKLKKSLEFYPNNSASKLALSRVNAYLRIHSPSLLLRLVSYFPLIILVLLSLKFLFKIPKCIKTPDVSWFVYIFAVIILSLGFYALHNFNSYNLSFYDMKLEKPAVSNAIKMQSFGIEKIQIDYIMQDFGM